MRSGYFSIGIVLFFGLAGVGTSGPATAETVLGRWCDHMIPDSDSMNRLIVIRVGGEGGTIVHSEFFDGSVADQPLMEETGNIFAVQDSPSQDRYRVVPSTGDLQLLDADGLIRTARRMENSGPISECPH